MTEFTDEEWKLIEQAVKPVRFQNEEYGDLYYKICQREINNE